MHERARLGIVGCFPHVSESVNQSDLKELLWDQHQCDFADHGDDVTPPTRAPSHRPELPRLCHHGLRAGGPLRAASEGGIHERDVDGMFQKTEDLYFKMTSNNPITSTEMENAWMLG